MDDLLELLTIDDLYGTQREIADCIGLESYIRLVRRFAGEPLNIPMPASIALEARNRRIIADFTGYNYSELGKKFQLSENTIRTIVRDTVREKRNEPMEGQITFF